MASRKKNYRGRNVPSNRSEDNFNNRGNFNNHRTGNSPHRESHFFCDACGFSVSQPGTSPPMCTRCLIPMQLLRQSAINRNKTDKKQAFDYSARIYYQTDGHPQFKGLPIDHPDPEDVMAVEAYKARKEAHRRRPGKPSGGDAQKADRFSADKQRRKPPHTSSQQGSMTPRRHHDNRRPEAAAPNHPESALENAKPQAVTPEIKKPVEIKREKRRRPPAKRPADTVAVSEKPVQEELPKNIPTPREEDYAGTALTSDRSAATILSDTRRHESNTNSIGNLHSDYAYNPAESAKKQSPDTETEAVSSNDPQ